MSLQTVYVICMMLETPRWGAESSTLGLDLQSNIGDLPPRSLKAIMMLRSVISGSAFILHVGHTCFCTSVHVLLASLGIYMLRPKNDKPALKSSRPNPHFHQEAQSSASQEKNQTRCPIDQPRQATALYLAHRMCRKRRPTTPDSVRSRSGRLQLSSGS
jgi:hypothetical protein